jgi:hypothetical protein
MSVVQSSLLSRRGSCWQCHASQLDGWHKSVPRSICAGFCLCHDDANLSLKLQKPVGCRVNLASLKLIIARRCSLGSSLAPEQARAREPGPLFDSCESPLLCPNSIRLPCNNARGTLDANGSSKNLRAWFYKSRGIIALAASRLYP